MNAKLQRLEACDELRRVDAQTERVHVKQNDDGSWPDLSNVNAEVVIELRHSCRRNYDCGRERLDGPFRSRGVNGEPVCLCNKIATSAAAAMVREALHLERWKRMTMEMRRRLQSPRMHRRAQQRC